MAKEIATTNDEVLPDLPMEDRARQINAAHAALVAAASYVAIGYIDMGRLLCEAKAEGKRAGEIRNRRERVTGNSFRWIPWVKENLAFDRVQAWKYMEAYRLRDEIVRKIVTRGNDFSSLNECLASVRESRPPPDGDWEKPPRSLPTPPDDVTPNGEPEADQPEGPSPEPDPMAEAIARSARGANTWVKMLEAYVHILESIREMGGVSVLCAGWDEEQLGLGLGWCDDVIGEIEELRHGFQDAKGSRGPAGHHPVDPGGREGPGTGHP